MDNNINAKISECKALIESQVRWGSHEHWKQRDFEQLSDLIFEKTATRLSLSTLKRIWYGQFSNAPQPATLNALAQFAGFRSWNDFRLSNTADNTIDIHQASPEIEEKGISKNQKRIRILLGTLILCGVVFLIFLLIQEGRGESENLVVKLNPKVNFSHKILAEGLPNTVVFSFDLAKLKADSFFFQQTWDYKTRVSIPAKSKNFTSIYYYPGYHTAKLFAGKTQVAEQKVHVKTNGWQGLITSGMNQSMPVYLKNAIHNGMLYVPLSELPVQKSISDKGELNVRYYNVSDFQDITGDDFQLSAKIRNDIENGGLTCQDVKFYIACDSGMMIVPFCMPGCVGNLNLVAGDNFLAGRNNDLSALGINLSEWQEIRLVSNQKNIQIKTSTTALTIPYSKPLGKIKGLMVEFRGSGAIDKISLVNQTKQIMFEWTFDKVTYLTQEYR